MILTKKASALKGIFLAVMLILMSAATVQAETMSRTGTATGHYRDPQTNVIIDSGGEENEALGQSMVDNVVGTAALLEEIDGQSYMTVRFNLASNLSRIDLSTQEVGESEWTPVETIEKDRGEDSVDLCFPVAGENTIVRAECFVDAMGRAVIFFITVSDYTEGNTSGYSDLDASLINTQSSAAAGTASESSASSADASGDGLLDNVKGLTVGGSTDKASSESSSAQTEDSSKTDSVGQSSASQGSTVSSSTLVLGTGVWVRIFLISFSGCLLAGLVLMLFRFLAAKFFGNNKKEQVLDLNDEEDENDDIQDDDWEDED